MEKSGKAARSHLPFLTRKQSASPTRNNKSVTSMLSQQLQLSPEQKNINNIKEFLEQQASNSLINNESIRNNGMYRLEDLQLICQQKAPEMKLLSPCSESYDKAQILANVVAFLTELQQDHNNAAIVVNEESPKFPWFHSNEKQDKFTYNIDRNKLVTFLNQHISNEIDKVGL